MSERMHELHQAGQSVWLDYIDRTMLSNGELEAFITEDALMGMTSNPTIFEKALAEGTAYDEQVSSVGASTPVSEAFETIAATDVRNACDVFRGVYDKTKAVDGYVSLEVSPKLARDTAGTIAEAKRLWKLVDRPNLMIKVPGTAEGAPAVEELIAAGINVNVTLLFAIEAHAKVIESYLAGLEQRVAKGEPVDRIASVASFFVSRVDSAVDKQLDEKAANASHDKARAAIQELCGKAAIANAKLAYELFEHSFSGARWEALSKRGAMVQRPLWASTSTKNPAYRDVMYVEQLIGPNTVNTLPPATLEAFRDHGEVRVTVNENVEGARKILSEIESRGISMEKVTEKLLDDGIASFAKSYETLLAGLDKKRTSLASGDNSNKQSEKSGAAPVASR